MAWLMSAAVSCDSDFRFKRKFHSYLLLACVSLLIATTANARSTKETDSDVIIPPADEELQLNEEYTDVDNVEFHQAQMINGVLKEDHPVIMYKEDFVSEDFVPKTDAPHRLRKHKDPAHRRHRRLNNRNHSHTEHYHPLQPEKIYFDILSSAPIVSSSEAKLAPSKMNVEVLSLADADTKLNTDDDDDTEAKRKLEKRTKKFHHRRQRRDTTEQHNIHKRNPYYSYYSASKYANSLSGPAPPSNQYLPTWNYGKRFEKHPVPGNYHNGPVSVGVALENRFGGPDNTDRVIWRDYTPTRNPNQRLDIAVRPPLPLFPQNTTPAPQSIVTQRPQSRPAGNPSISNEGNIPNTINTAAPPTIRYPTETPASKRTSLHCVWAITSCCQPNDQNVPYKCFERYGCPFYFWGRNPCVEETRERILSYLLTQFD